ncbi:alpha/beta hydrolase [Embleya scabrispora]|uniref:Alpha/beta hydrolase n=1 Tax=Embleya scabrispora TaxID=159449 RepID=A0A1T3NSF1_9ACTN|nr:alpha/beta hydrolase [Embleya scabrispora]OPC79675.1 alpha/beta hydrolase [Embleya scabrispora]
MNITARLRTRVLHTVTAAAVAATAGVLAAPHAAADDLPPGVTKVANSVDVRCAAFVYHRSSDWYFPTGAAKGLVWLQHGFSRSNGQLGDLAGRYAAAGFLVFAPTLPSADLFGCTVSNLGNNTAFLDHVADLFGKASDPADKLARSFADARTRAGRPDLALPEGFVFAGHSAGGEAVAYTANRLRTTYPAAFARLRGLVLLDPVNSFTGLNMANALNGLAPTPLPMTAISSPPYTANGNASGTVELTTDVHRPFLGVRLTTGSHCDAEGGSTDSLCTLLNGTPQARNVATLQTLAVRWALDDVDGTHTASHYPGGSVYEALRTDGVVQTLTGS